MSGAGFYYTPKQTLNGRVYYARIQQTPDAEYHVCVMVDGEFAEGLHTQSNNITEFETACKIGRELVILHAAQNTTTQPLDVDMGGDFEGFVEAVNQPQVAQSQVWYTDEVTSADGEKITTRVTFRPLTNDYLVEVLASGMAVKGETDEYEVRANALHYGNLMSVAYLQRLNAVRAAEMGDETETIYPPLMDKPGRKAQLEAHITRLRRDLQDYEYEYSQLMGN